MRLVADVMLAKLARWLRLSGNKVESSPYTSDNEIISYVKRRKAVLLTLDENLADRARKQKFKVLLVKGNSLEEQLAFVAKRLKLRLRTTPASICPYCNVKLVRISKKKAMERVPERVASLYSIFYECPSCKRVYWKGSHWNKISERLKRAKALERQVAMK